MKKILNGLYTIGFISIFFLLIGYGYEILNSDINFNSFIELTFVVICFYSLIVIINKMMITERILRGIKKTLDYNNKKSKEEKFDEIDYYKLDIDEYINKYYK